MDTLCELAASGVNQAFIYALVVTIILVAATALSLRKKISLALLLVIFVLSVFSTYSSPVLAAENCPPNQTDSNNTPPTQEPAPVNGYLQDDMFSFYYDEENGWYGSDLMDILNNDESPDNDPIVPSTLKMILYPGSAGFHIDDEYGQRIVIGEDFDDPIGAWYRDHDCIDPDNPTPETCTPVSNEFIGLQIWRDYRNEDPQPSFKMQYTVETESGLTLGPATVTAQLIDTPPPSPHFTIAEVIEYDLRVCTDGGVSSSSPELSINILSLVTSNFGSIVPESIDLDPATPGIQQTVTNTGPFGQTTFSVDGSGNVSFATVGDADPHPAANFTFTVQDTEGNTSSPTSGFNLSITVTSCQT